MARRSNVVRPPASPRSRRRRPPSPSGRRARVPKAVLAVLLLAGLVGLAWLDPDLVGDLLPGGASQVGNDGLQGPVTHVRDGDTIEVSDVPVRIANLACAEMDTEAGQRARERMVELVRGKAVACDLEGRMSYDREVGTCALAVSGEDLGEILIAEGTCGRWRG